MVSLAVVALLIGLLLPSLAAVRETANRVVCRSNVRQQGIGIVMFTDAHGDMLPPTIFAGPWAEAASDMEIDGDTMTLRFVVPASTTPQKIYGFRVTGWDGLGRLYAEEYLNAPGIFYCPSHRGPHPIEKYLPIWRADRGEIVGNYQYRGAGPGDVIYLNNIEPTRTALVTDGLRSIEDFNHVVGTNVLRADLSVGWWGDPGLLSQMLAAGDGSGDQFDSAWDLLDQGSRYDPDGDP